MEDFTQFRMPGQLIQALLDARGWSQRVLAVVLNADETGMNKIIAGKRAVDAEMAIALSGIFDIEPEKFLELQKKWDLAQAKIKTMDDPARKMRAELFGKFPVSDMIKRGWLDADDIRDFPKVESALAKFFGVSSVNEIETFAHAAKKTNVNSEATGVQLAWLYRVREIADEMLTSKFSPEAVQQALLRLKPLLKRKESIPKIPRILQDCGIRFLIVEALPGAKIDGVCFWLDENKPVIAMTLRYDRIDNFWFVLRHEIEHVLREDGRTENTVMLDTELEGEQAGTGDNVAEQERFANAAAAEFCVPQKALKDFMARKAPFFHDRDIIGFAGICNTHPGLVAGQLRHKLKRYDRFQIHLEKIRNVISPNALVDGWGNVVPVGN